MENSKILKVNNEIKSFNLVINGVWGSGKTTFIDLFQNEINTINNKLFEILKFNAWNIDYFNDPLEPFVSFLIKKKNIFNSFGIDIMKSMLNLVNLNLNKTMNLFFKNKNTKNLELVKNKYDKLNKKLIFIIDDLDRCSPKFCIRLFELIKHLVNHNNVIFIALFNWNQMNKSIHNLYGLDYSENNEFYLEKIFDYKWDLPIPSKLEIISNRLKNIDHIWLFDDIQGCDIDAKIEFINFVSLLFNDDFSIREINRVIDEYKLGYLIRREIEHNCINIEFFIFYFIKNKITSICFKNLLTKFNEYLNLKKVENFSENKFIDFFWNFIIGNNAWLKKTKY